MVGPGNDGVPKVHPATRQVEPEDPMNLHGFEVPGDPELMLRILVEEYARMGVTLDALMGLARDPFYQGFHGLWLLYGEDELRNRLSEILSRCGVMQTRVEHSTPMPEQLVELELPQPSDGRRDDA
jgi:hypothetical protein